MDQLVCLINGSLWDCDPALQFSACLFSEFFIFLIFFFADRFVCFDLNKPVTTFAADAVFFLSSPPPTISNHLKKKNLLNGLHRATLPLRKRSQAHKSTVAPSRMSPGAPFARGPSLTGLYRVMSRVRRNLRQESQIIRHRCCRPGKKKKKSMGDGGVGGGAVMRKLHS